VIRIHRCNRRRSHYDAEAFVEWMTKQGGFTSLSWAAIAVAMGISYRRIRLARMHMLLTVDRLTGKACTGYSLHYRKSGGISYLYLVDLSASSSSTVMLAHAFGFFSRRSQWRTERGRAVQMWEEQATIALNGGDARGYRACTRAATELDATGDITPTTWAEVESWVATLA